MRIDLLMIVAMGFCLVRTHMKRYIVYTLLMVFLPACLTIWAETSINTNGSGTVVTKYDMGRMFSTVEKIAAHPLQGEKFYTVLDTVIYMKNDLDRISRELKRRMSRDEKQLYANTEVHLALNKKKDLFSFVIRTKFSNLQQLSLLGEVNKQALKYSPLYEPPPAEGDTTMEAFLAKSDSALSFHASNGIIENRFDSTRYVKDENDEKLATNFAYVKETFGEMPVTSIYNLPRAIKKITTKSGSVISSTKKKVTITYDYLEAIRDPSLQAFRIEY